MKYINTSDLEVTIPGLGVVKPGEEVEMPKDFNNANFKLQNKTPHKKVDEEDEESK